MKKRIVTSSKLAPSLEERLQIEWRIKELLAACDLLEETGKLAQQEPVAHG